MSHNVFSIMEAEAAATACIATVKDSIAVLIGEGSYGKVYRMHDSTLGFFARKHCFDKFEQEVCALKILHAHPHENVVRVLRIANADAVSACFDLELCDMDLLTYFEKYERLSEATMRHIARQLVAALCHCVNNGVFHGDLKPENVLLCDGVVKLADFGFAAFQRQVPHKLSMTVQYAPPELLCIPPPASVDAELVDVWSFGVTLVSCVTGFAPFEVSNDFSVCGRYKNYVSLCAGNYTAAAVRTIILNDTMKDAPLYSPELHAFVSACLQPLFYKRSTFMELALHPWLRMP